MDYRRARIIGKKGRRPPSDFSRLPVVLRRTHIAIHCMLVGRRAIQMLAIVRGSAAIVRVKTLGIAGLLDKPNQGSKSTAKMFQ